MMNTNQTTFRSAAAVSFRARLAAAFAKASEIGAISKDGKRKKVAKGKWEWIKKLGAQGVAAPKSALKMQEEAEKSGGAAKPTAAKSKPGAKASDSGDLEKLQFTKPGAVKPPAPAPRIKPPAVNSGAFGVPQANVQRRVADLVAKGVSPDDARAMVAWVHATTKSGNSKQLRRFQRGALVAGDASKARYEEQSRQVERFLTIAGQKKNHPLWRGVRLSADAAEALKPGHAFDMGTTASWANKPDVANSFLSGKPEGGLVPVLFEMQGGAARSADVSDLSGHETEAETLVSKSTRLHVVSSEVKGGIRRVVVREIQSAPFRASQQKVRQ